MRGWEVGEVGSGGEGMGASERAGEEGGEGSGSSPSLGMAGEEGGEGRGPSPSLEGEEGAEWGRAGGDVKGTWGGPGGGTVEAQSVITTE